ncbi:MAG: tRNA (adenosine(37)-N6)-dimethylallyltransferase MiaA [Leptolyngbya sp. SIO4C1]|nr:tRNA (adenosine(37)-N6)-dimethylallyltransferase MiaA [Leptolyngbya sp. SIO4C1]
MIVAGPTAVGKSGLALALAQRLDTAILSADSRQVYREFDIGTAKPSLAEQQQVPHYLIDICDPTETLTVADYQQQAQAIVAQVQAQRRVPLLVGGTGLYINAIAKGLKIPPVAPQAELRSQLSRLGQPHCYQFLQQIDPAAALRIHPNDRVRTLRALEVYYVTGRPISAQQGERPPRYPILSIGLDCAGLSQRIEQRTQQMVAQGLVDEVSYLIKQYGADLPLLKTLGYAEMQQYLAGNADLATAIELTVQHTRQFAKRQRTWFRKDKQIVWFDAAAPDLLARVWQQIQAFLQTVSSDS